MEEYNNGAKRSVKLPRYRDVSHSFIRRIAEAMRDGAAVYEKDLLSWQKNYKRGDTDFALDAIDHAINHMLAYKEQLLDSLNNVVKDDNEDHLGHLGANLVMLDYWESIGFFDPWADNFEKEIVTGTNAVIVDKEPEPLLPVEDEKQATTIADRILTALGLGNPVA